MLKEFLGIGWICTTRVRLIGNGCVLGVPKKVCIDWKSLSIFNNKISFECGGWSESLLFFYLTVFVKFGLLYVERVFRGWVDMYNKGQVDWKWFSIFYSCLTFVC